VLRIAAGSGSVDEQWENGWLRSHGLDAAHAPTGWSLGSVVPWTLWAGLIANSLGLACVPRLGVIASNMSQPVAVAIGSAAAVAIAAISLGAARLLAPRMVIVGSDGVAIRHAFRRSFVPHADIERVEFVGRAGLRLQIVGGKALRAGWMLGAVRRDALVALIDRWHQRASPLPEQLGTLRRDGRPVSEWIDALGNVFAAASYRSEATTPAHALVAIDNAAAPVELRIGAIVALLKAGLIDTGAAERLRAAAATFASERMVRAIDELATGRIDAATIEAALAEGAPVKSGVRTGQRQLQWKPSPAARRAAAPEGAAVVQTHFDGFMLAIIGWPIVPLAISIINVFTSGDREVWLAIGVPSAIWLPYFFAWLVSRIRSERRFVFYPDRVWLPGFYHRIRGRFIAYPDIAHLAGDSRHLHIVLTTGKTRVYEGNVVNFRELEDTFERFGVTSRR
jgi:hypothetical protein